MRILRHVRVPVDGIEKLLKLVVLERTTRHDRNWKVVLMLIETIEMKSFIGYTVYEKVL